MTAQTTGRRVGSRYLIRRMIGEGGICTVYEAVHLYTSRRVAVKLLNEEYCQHEEARLRLLDEGRALGMVRHPNIVEIHDAGTWENAPYIITELLHGRNVEGLLTSRGRFSAPDALNVARQVALGLGAAHSAGIVHRDVKPGNVVIVKTPVGREKATLIDFGVARLPRGADKTSQRFGDRDGFVGTPEYMSPEQLKGRSNIDGRTDVYALGVMLWECLTEAVPIPGTWREVQAFHDALPTPSLRSVRADLPPSVTELVDRCLARDARERFPDMQALVNAIDATGLCRSSTRLLEYGQRDVPDFTATLTSGEHRAPSPADTLRYNTARDALAAPKQSRTALRAPFNAPVRVLVDDESVDLRGEDLSENGMLAIGPKGFVVGENASLRFALPNTGELVTIPATVRWIRDRSGSARASCAIGFAFRDTPPSLRTSLANYVALMAHG